MKWVVLLVLMMMVMIDIEEENNQRPKNNLRFIKTKQPNTHSPQYVFRIHFFSISNFHFFSSHFANSCSLPLWCPLKNFWTWWPQLGLKGPSCNESFWWWLGVPYKGTPWRSGWGPSDFRCSSQWNCRCNICYSSDMWCQGQGRGWGKCLQKCSFTITTKSIPTDRKSVV